MKKTKRIGITLFIALLVISAISYFVFYIPFSKIKAKGMAVMVSAKELKQAFSENNIDLLNKKLGMFDEKYAEFEKEAQSVYWAKTIPYVADFKNGVEAGRFGIEAAKSAVEAISPYADLIGFKKGETSFVEKSAEGRLQTAVLTLDKVLKNIDVISSKIGEIEKRLQKIDESRYPESVGGRPVKATIKSIKDQFSGVSTLFVDAKPLLKRLPEIFGSKKEQTYLILFQNDKERRATGGFLTAYAVFKIKDGKMTIDKSEDMYSLDATINERPSLPREIREYFPTVKVFNIRDSNLSPDFAKSLDLFNSLYKRSGARVKYDGVIALDTQVLVDMLTIFGDTEVDGIVFSAKKDPRCDCPQVIYRLLETIGEEVGYQKENRKGILGDLMYELFYKALRFSPSRYWGTLAQTMFKNLDQKHILLSFVDSEIQTSVEKLNYAGRIRETKNDYLHINNVNFGGQKSNLFVNEQVSSTTQKQGDKVRREVEIVFRNPFPPSNCNRNQERVLCLNAVLRNWIRFYVPKGSQLISLNGSETKVQSYDDLDKTVFEGFLRVNPLGYAKVKVVYTLPQAINGDELYIQKQPGVQNQKYKVVINGKKAFDGVLEKDTLIK